jgi:ubiquinone/menaquinone biosynthesis C-methylase UbiE
MQSNQGPDPQIQQFSQRVIDNVSAASFSAMVSIGDRLGLFRAMAGRGAVLPAELAKSTELSERHVREWLNAMVAGEYVTYDPTARTYTLPPAHAAVLADDKSMFFLGGVVQLVPSVASAMPLVLEAFRTGHGIHEDSYSTDFCEAAERSNAPLYDNVLPTMLVPAIGIKDRLEAGGTMLDVGCGSGRACLAIARTYPKARVLGYDQNARSIERARANARAAGIQDRVAFDVVDCATLPRHEIDLVTAFDVLHDAPDPVAILVAMRNALKPGGVCFVQEFGSSAEPHDNIGALGKMFYSQSAMYCLNVSLHHHGPGLGSLMGEAKIRELATAAGFTKVDKLPVPHPVFSFYAMRG